MTVIALVMAGGRGTRMDSDTEKPLLDMGGKPMILCVLDALRGSKEVNDIIVATSKHTPRTAEALRSLGIKVIETPGEGYVEDTRFAVKSLGLKKTLVISSDLPLITSDLIDEVIHEYETSGKPALAVAYPESLKKTVCIDTESFEHGGKKLFSAGVNLLDGERINEEQLDEKVVVMERLELAFNVNTLEDLLLTKSMMKSNRGR